jgi:hypothetical protein
MARIRVTGYLETDDVDPEDVDLDHKMGLSASGYEKLSSELGLDEVEFELEK